MISSLLSEQRIMVSLFLGDASAPLGTTLRRYHSQFAVVENINPCPLIKIIFIFYCTLNNNLYAHELNEMSK
jgi:hypothetical protein